MVENNDTAVLKTEGVNLQVTALFVNGSHLGFKCFSLAWGSLSNLLGGGRGGGGKSEVREMIDSFRVSLCGRSVLRPVTCCSSNQ